MSIDEIEKKLDALMTEREEIEDEIVQIENQLDMRNAVEDQEWRPKAKCALRYKRLDREQILRDYKKCERELKAAQHEQTMAHEKQRRSGFHAVFVTNAFRMLSTDDFERIRNATLAEIGSDA